MMERLAPAQTARTIQNAAAAPKDQGSLAFAFQEMNSNIDQLEVCMKELWERLSPMLEPCQPMNPSPTEPGRAASPLAETVFDYAARVRVVRQGVDEILSRFSY